MNLDGRTDVAPFIAGLMASRHVRLTMAAQSFAMQQRSSLLGTD